MNKSCGDSCIRVALGWNCSDVGYHFGENLGQGDTGLLAWDEGQSTFGWNNEGRTHENNHIEPHTRRHLVFPAFCFHQFELDFGVWPTITWTILYAISPVNQKLMLSSPWIFHQAWLMGNKSIFHRDFQERLLLKFSAPFQESLRNILGRFWRTIRELLFNRNLFDGLYWWTKPPVTPTILTIKRELDQITENKYIVSYGWVLEHNT